MERKQKKTLGVLSVLAVQKKRLIKICGITRLEDALVSIEHGANALGFNFYPKSPRYIAPEDAEAIIEQLPEEVLKVAVVVQGYRVPSTGYRDPTPNPASHVTRRASRKSDTAYRVPGSHEYRVPSTGYREKDNAARESDPELREPSTENRAASAEEPVRNRPWRDDSPLSIHDTQLTTHGSESLNPQSSILNCIQFHGIETPEEIPVSELPLIIATSPKNASRFNDHDIIIDTSWGRGELADWEALRSLDRPYILSGGLDPNNIEEAIDLLNPAGIDVCSGVEGEPGIKDHEKLKEFLMHVSTLAR